MAHQPCLLTPFSLACLNVLMEFNKLGLMIIASFSVIGSKMAYSVMRRRGHGRGFFFDYF